MYDANFWYIFPVFFIPQSIIWLSLDTLFDSFHINKRIAEKMKRDERTVSKWIHRINCIVSYVITFFLCLIILRTFFWKKT